MTDPARSTARDLVTAGLDLLTARERHADGLAFACATSVESRGGVDVTVTTHEAALGERRHVALVIDVAGLAEVVVADAVLVAATASEEASYGLLIGRTFTGAAELQPVIQTVIDAHRPRTGGRAVVFPGSTTVNGTTTVGQLLASTTIERVEVLGQPEPEPDPGTTLITRNFLRPRWSNGTLVLHAQPARGGALVPFEAPDPTPCCAEHC